MTETPDLSLVYAFSHELNEPLSRAAFTQLYEANARPIFAYVLAITGHREIAEDLVQEAFCRVLGVQGVARVTTMDVNEARRYLFRIATNLVHDRWRSRKDLAASITDDSFSVSVRSEMNFDICLDVRAMLARLKPRQRELLWLAYVEGMDHTEIAEATGLALLSVRMLLFRARKEARRFLSAAKPAQSGFGNDERRS